jgi:acetoin utilization protein AcuC
MSDRRPAFLYSAELAALQYPPECPFQTGRAVRTRERLRSFGLLDHEVAPRVATRAEAEQFHSARYLDELERAAAGDLRVEGLHLGLGTPDTPVFPDLYRYALAAAGATLTGAELILAGQADIVFNPWGGFHHAMPEKAAGFCYVNDPVLGILRLTAAGKRVLFLDVDVHHGDLHESGKTLFPWGGFEDEIGEGDGRGFNVNIPLPAETYDAAYLRAFRQVVVPLVEAHRPDVLVIELGMDALAGDPLTHLRLTNNAHADILDRLLRFNRPMLVVGGGGYHLENTVRGWALAWKTLCGEEEHDLSFGMGGVMLGSSEWAGGLRDHELPVTPEQRAAVEPALDATLATIIRTVFPLHGLPVT